MMHVSRPPVQTPPSAPSVSNSIVFAPERAADMAAAIPAGPPPATITSKSPAMRFAAVPSGAAGAAIPPTAGNAAVLAMKSLLDMEA